MSNLQLIELKDRNSHFFSSRDIISYNNIYLMFNDIIDSFLPRNLTSGLLTFDATNVKVDLSKFTGQLGSLTEGNVQAALELADKITGGGGSGLNTNQVNALILPFARTGNTSTIPDGKISSTFARAADIPNVANFLTTTQIQALFSSFALVGSTDRIPRNRLDLSVLTTSSNIPPERILFSTAQKNQLGTSVTTADLNLLAILTDFMVNLLSRNSIVTQTASGTASIESIVNDWALAANTSIKIPVSKVPLLTSSELPANTVYDSDISEFKTETEIKGYIAGWAEEGDSSTIPPAKIPVLDNSKIPVLDDDRIPATIPRDSELPDTIDNRVAPWAREGNNDPFPYEKAPGRLRIDSASSISVGTANLNGTLSSADDTVQKAFDTLDNISAEDIPVDSAGFSNNLASSDNNLQKVAQAVNDFVGSGGSGVGLTAGQVRNLIADWAETGNLDDFPVGKMPNLDANKITSGVLGTHIIPNLDADKITTGELNKDRIPNLNASKINAGILDTARIPNLNADKITTGMIDDARIPSTITRDSELPDVTAFRTETQIKSYIVNWAEEGNSSLIPGSKTRFYLQNTAPTNPQLGWIWSNPDTGIIQAYKRNARNPAEDMNSLIHSNNLGVQGIFGNDGYLYITNSAYNNYKIFAYYRNFKSRNSTQDFNTLAAAGNHSARGIWGNASYLWVVDDVDDKIYAYNFTSKTRNVGQDFNTLATSGNNNPRDIWSDGTTMWVVDTGGTGDAKVYAYNLSNKARISSKEFNTLVAAGNDSPTGIASNGQYMWIADNDDNKAYAYRMPSNSINSSPGGTAYAREPSQDINTLQSAGNINPQGMHIQGTTLWIIDLTSIKVFAYTIGDAWHQI